ncbi:MAG: hypothetical protein E7341_02160 [Clostridiales bacterium]|nr:hypothetical protein [Clostridiales bacterium]
MNIERETKKQKAIENLKKLDIYKPYIKGFKNEDNICYFENYGGYWAWQEPELIEKVKELEEQHNCLVYAITHEYTAIGEMYSFLIVTDYEEEWDTLLEKYGNQYYGFAYVWNVDDDMCSEFGTIALSSFGGGIRRIG